MEEEEEGWWKGRVDGKEGLFPSNFVEMLEQNGSSDPVHDYSVPPPLDKREYMGRVGLLDWNVCPTFVYGNVVCEGGCVHVHVCVCMSRSQTLPKSEGGSVRLYVCAHLCFYSHHYCRCHITCHHFPSCPYPLLLPLSPLSPAHNPLPSQR